MLVVVVLEVAGGVVVVVWEESEVSRSGSVVGVVPSAFGAAVVGVSAISELIVVDAPEAGKDNFAFAATSGAARAVGASVTSLRTLPTAAAATATAMNVAASQAALIPTSLLMRTVWSRFRRIGLTEG